MYKSFFIDYNHIILLGENELHKKYVIFWHINLQYVKMIWTGKKQNNT